MSEKTSPCVIETMTDNLAGWGFPAGTRFAIHPGTGGGGCGLTAMRINGNLVIGILLGDGSLGTLFQPGRMIELSSPDNEVLGEARPLDATPNEAYGAELAALADAFVTALTAILSKTDEQDEEDSLPA